MSVKIQTEDPQKQLERKKQPPSEMHGAKGIALRYEALEQKNLLLFVRRGDNRIVLQHKEGEPRNILLFMRRGESWIVFQRHKRGLCIYPPSQLRNKTLTVSPPNDEGISLAYAEDSLTRNARQRSDRQARSAS